MQDGIIKGTGNSRFLKSIPDFLTQYPTYESFVAALAAGTLPVDFNGINETGWQQLGTALNKGNLLSDETAAMYPDLPKSKVPDDAFRHIAIALNLLKKGSAFVELTVKTAAGNPLQGIQINGMVDDAGSPARTNSAGVAAGYVKPGRITLSIAGYADINGWSKTYDFDLGKIYTDKISLTVKNFVKYTSSTTVKFSPNVSRVDVSVGGGGSAGYSFNGTSTGGSGGGGGWSSARENVTFQHDTSYSLTVGSGGTFPGGAGGNSSFLGVSASGAPSHMDANGGSGNGRGGKGGYANQSSGGWDISPGTAGQAGSGFVYTSFTENSPGYGGGGGGGGFMLTSYPEVTGAMTGGRAGSPGGGRGANAPTSTGTNAGTPGTNGLGGGGGGGGICRTYSSEARATCGNGGSGVVAIRMHLKIS